ncbi:pentapeptide repeat-containing protein [Streptomyces sp. NBC_00996]|uniref:pentapeptide repeat-containing protein n=1 Tax=Streptomyces sp. NBC_00996 TaxID=2903710 RepID=UPI00386849D5|nr:pentapeptide repeat-containing protein [Streptomyces sp. NBC_00996]
MSTPSPPPWPHCGRGANTATAPIGCQGIHVPGNSACLAHLTDTNRTAYLAGLSPGADIDHRGTPFTQQLLEDLLNALKDPSTGKPHLGIAMFTGAQFSGDAEFTDALFSGDVEFTDALFSGETKFTDARFSDTAAFTDALFSGTAEFAYTRFSGEAVFVGTQFSGTTWFHSAQFSGEATFSSAQFSGEVRFSSAQFFGDAWFSHVQFSGHASFYETQFSGIPSFGEAQFSGYAAFDGAQFSGHAMFASAQFSDDVSFDGVRFEDVSVLGPLVCAGQVVLSGAVFVLPVTLEIAAQAVVCKRTRWESTATIRVRYSAVDFGHAVLAAPVAVIAHPAPFHFTYSDSPVSERLLAGPGRQPRSPDRVRVVSVQGVDAAHLVLTDIDLADCLFSGAFHLDQLRLEGRTMFAPTPIGWQRRGIRPVRFTRRRTLAEEHHWRAQTAGQPVPNEGAAPEPRLWRPGPHHTDPARTPDPEDVAALYRQLRKAFEDGKNEPGAADFYYGECEMRRHDTTGTTKGERRLLWAYWLLSGYGLRASRAFTWLLAAMSLTVLLLMAFGLPARDPDPATTGTLNGSKISLNTSTPDPALRGGWSQRWSWARAEKATRVAVNSVVFRSSGQNLTTAGTYIEMTSRLLEPTLLTLGVLAIRGRIKR